MDYNKLSLEELLELKSKITNLCEQKYNEEYAHVYIMNSEGKRIIYRIQKETLFYTTWEGMSGCVGEVTIRIPKRTFSVELEQELKEKYNNID